MQKNVTILRIWEIPIRVNISLLVFLPILAWLIGSAAQLDAYASLINTMTPADVDASVLTESERWLIAIGAAVGLFASVTFHELGHAWAALRYDIRTESITLWILGGIASLSEMPREWNREFWIAVAGPISSLVLAAGCLGALAVLPTSMTVVVFVLGFLAVMNVVLAVFNLLPAFPMDGGRVLRALLARNRPYVRATQTAASIGTGFALFFAFIGIVVAFSPLLVLLALFIYVAATSESRSVVLGELLSGLTVSDILDEYGPIEAEATAAEVFDRLLGARRSEIAVVENGELIGIVTGEALKDLPLGEYETTTARDLATSDHPRFEADMSAFDALHELMRGRSDVGIVERESESVGVVSRNDFTTVLDIRRESVAF